MKWNLYYLGFRVKGSGIQGMGFGVRVRGSVPKAAALTRFVHYDPRIVLCEPE